MNTYGATLVWITGVVGALVAVVVFALFMALWRAAKRGVRSSGDTALLSAALQDALARLAAQERAMSARAVASEQLSTQVFDSLTAGLIVVDDIGRVKLANPAAVRMLSLPPDASGRNYADVLAAAPPLVDVLAEGLTARRAILRRALHVHGGGGSSHFGVTVSPLGDAGGPNGAICLFSDLTQVVELEQQLQLKEALARLGELTAGIAHEFRNGLATIHGYSRLIDPQAIPERFRPCVEGIRQETDALGHIVTSFLDFARPERIALLPLALEAVARRAAGDLEGELPPSTTVTTRGTFATVEGDEVLLRQLFANLIRNAAEACDVVGTAPVITITGRLDEARSTALVTVDDNGPGIPEADRGRIFQPFFTTRSRGSGLGLSIVQKIALLHNGNVSVGHTNGSGTRIELSLPLCRAATAPPLAGHVI